MCHTSVPTSCSTPEAEPGERVWLRGAQNPCLGDSLDCVVHSAVSDELQGKHGAVVDDSKDQIQCAVRRNIPDEVITGRWQNGPATLSSGQVIFQPRNSFGLPVNRGTPFLIHVPSIPKDTGRQPSLRQAMRIDPSLRIIAWGRRPDQLSLPSPADTTSDTSPVLRGIQQLLGNVDQTALCTTSSYGRDGCACWSGEPSVTG